MQQHFHEIFLIHTFNLKYENKIKFKLFFFIKEILCNFSVGTLQYQKEMKLFFAPENMKKQHSKVAHNRP